MDKDIDKELAKQRFTMQPQDVRIVHIPQCNSCKKNIDFIKCKEFAEKPQKYMDNDEECPVKVPE